MASLFKNQVLKHLSKFAKNLNPEHVNISAFRGEGELHHLELNEEILTELLELPSWLQIKRAFCNRVTARIPWASLKSTPIKLHLDDLELVIETTEELRPLSKVHVPSYSSGGSYGFVDKVIDGISVYVGNVIVTFRSQVFFASIELSQVTLESRTPMFKQAELKYTRLKDTRRGETLLFKELQFASMKIQACSTVDAKLSPLRLITNDARCRITLKKKLSDCSVVGCRLAVVVDTLLYVFTDSQLRAAKVFVDSLLHLIKKGQEQAKKVKALRKLESTELRDDIRTAHLPQTAGGQRNPTAQPVCSPFQAHDVVETSYHFACKQLELHLSDDAGPGRSSHPDLKNGGAVVVTLGRLYFDYYPYHPVGSWEGPGARKHWVKYPPGTPPAIWEAEDLTAFKAHLSSILRNCRPSHAPLQRTTNVEDGANEAARAQSQPQSRSSLDSGSNWSTGRPPPALPQLKKLMSACLIFRLTEFRVHQVTTHEKKHLREFLSGDQDMAPLPGNSYRVHMEFIQYYYPGSMDFPLPPMKLYVHCNPIAVKFDDLTLCWANAVLGNLLSEWDLTGGRDGGEARADTDPDLPPVPPLDVKIEMIMPKVVLEGPECAGQPDRPTTLQFMSSRLLCSNYRQQGVGSRADLAKCLEGIQGGSMFFGSSFPSTQDDPALVHPKFVQHATGNDHVSPVPVPSSSEESSRKSSSGEASRDLLWYEARDVWFCQCDPVWGEFCGAKALDNRPVPLLDPIPLDVWIYARAKDGSAECYALLDVPSLVTVQLNHYQNLFLLRLVDRLAAMSEVLAADSERCTRPGAKRRICVGGMFPQVDVSLLMPSQTADEVEVATDVLDDASFVDPPTPSDELPSSLVRRKDVISVLTIRVGQVQLVQHIEDSVSVMKLECCHLALEDCPAIPWDEFQAKFSSGKHSWSDSAADPEHRCSVKIRYSQRKMARGPCHPFTQDVLSVSPEANYLLRSRLDRFSREQMRCATGGEDAEDDERWQRHLCRLLCEDLRSHGGTLVEMEVRDIRLHLLMSISMGLTALFEEEEIVPPLPMKIRVENVRVHLPDDRPPSSITSPPVMPLLFHVPHMTIIRDCAGVFHFLFCKDCTEVERRNSRTSGVQTSPIPPDTLPLPPRQSNHFSFSLPSGGGGLNLGLQRRVSQLEKENERLRRELVSAREAEQRSRQLHAALETSEQEKISLLQTMRYLQTDIMRLEEERTQTRRGSYLNPGSGA